LVIAFHPARRISRELKASAFPGLRNCISLLLIVSQVRKVESTASEEKGNQRSVAVHVDCSPVQTVVILLLLTIKPEDV
jgi:hypothetical protein